ALPKFWLIEDLWEFLHSLGMSSGVVDLFTFIAAAGVLVLLVWFLDMVIIRLSLLAIKRFSAKSKTTIDDTLVATKFFSRLFQLVPLIAVQLLAPVIFAGFHQGMILFVQLVTQSIIVVVSLLVVYSLLDTALIFYSARPAAGRISIKGYLQVAKIVLGFIAGILVIAVLTQKDVSNLFVGLGATAALFSLVFKDTILGFVASIQLSAQDMVRPGDWIEMPSKNADGTVLDINVNSVKVQNWDNTITMIPIYSMVSESFTNWRGMEQSSGRRFVRHLAVDIASITLANEELLKRLRQSPITAPYFEQTLSLAQQSSPAETLSNLALWRAHLELFLKRNANINQQMSIFVRYRPDISDKGLGVEIYAFSSEKNSELYDVVHRSVVEYVVTSSPLFNIALFQSPSGENFRRKN
ncbi:MAG: mechanosensitive ion channel, partial [Mucinivorans sp.]